MLAPTLYQYVDCNVNIVYAVNLMSVPCKVVSLQRSIDV